MAEAQTNSGAKLYICTTPKNVDQTLSDFQALAWVEVVGVGNVGERGANTNILTYDTWGTEVALKGKGITNAGDPVVECAYDASDAGQIALATAAAAKADNYCFKILRQDGQTAQFMRGLVTGPVEPGGRNEDFVLHNYTLALNQIPINGPASV